MSTRIGWVPPTRSISRSEMHPRLQAKLLRAIQEREIDRVGGTQPIRVNIRLLATSNRDLEEEVREGRFREDLFFRLNVVTIELPPLRARGQDVALLAEHFLAKYAEANGVPLPEMTEEAMRCLERHHWRGNVRELENTMHRAVLMARDHKVTAEAIILTGDRLAPKPEEVAQASATAGAHDGESQNDGEQDTSALVGRTVAEVERDLILDTLSHCLGNRTHAANILGISIRTLRNKLKQYSQEGAAVPLPGEAERARD